MGWRNVDSRVHFRPYKYRRPTEDGKEYKGDDAFWKPGRRTIFYKDSEIKGQFVIASFDADESEHSEVSVLGGFAKMKEPVTLELVEAFRSAYKFRDIKYLEVDKPENKSNLF